MAKHYWDKFEWSAWLNDPKLKRCSKETRGFWIDCIATMLADDQTYFIQGTERELCSLLFATPGEFKRSVKQLDASDAAIILTSGGIVKIVSRRRVKLINLREYNRLAKQRQRGQSHVNTPSNNSSKIDIKSLEIKSSEEKNKEKREEKQEERRPTRIPDEFPITQEMSAWLEKSLPDLNDVPERHANWVEHYTNATGTKAVRINWMLTWQKGMRLALKWQNEDKATGRVGQSGYVEPEIKCRTCNDLRTVLVKKKDAKFDWDMESVECPDCAVGRR